MGVEAGDARIQRGNWKLLKPSRFLLSVSYWPLKALGFSAAFAVEVDWPRIDTARLSRKKMYRGGRNLVRKTRSFRLALQIGRGSENEIQPQTDKVKRSKGLLDYYQILGIEKTATAVEIKSAYRRLARERHPDVNKGSKKAARDFAVIAIAYRTLGDVKKRANYDAQQTRRREILASPMSNGNPYLHRMRTVAAQARMDREIDELFAADRLENLAFQEAVYPTVALFVSTILAATLRPKFWQMSAEPGRVLLGAVFAIALWHIWRRLMSCMSRYGSTVDLNLTDAQVVPIHRTFSRTRIVSFLIGGVAICAVVGLLIGEQSQYIILQASPFFFDTKIHPELILYPPIGVLVVDAIHALMRKIDL